MGRHQGQAGGRGSKAETGQEPLLSFLWEGKDEAGQAGLG